jgi:hypothetical protein
MVDDPSTEAMARLTACQWLIRLADEARVSRVRALRAAETAIALLPRFASRELIRMDRESRVSELSSLAGLVAAAAVTAGHPERAVELLEQARGMLVAESIDSRGGDVGRLRSLQPALAEELARLRRRLDLMASDNRVVTALNNRTTAMDDAFRRRNLTERDERRRASADWEALLARIRAVDGFLLPKGIGDLAACAADGPVVIVYASPSRGDALIVTTTMEAPVRLVPLPHLTEDIVDQQVTRLGEAVRASSDPSLGLHARRDAQREVKAVLEWEWGAIAAPVLQELGYSARLQDGDPWPRIWWCPVGTLASLPLHAAGYHGRAEDHHAGPARAVIDLVISSYTATLRALGDARNRDRDRAPGSPLIISAPRVPGEVPLTGIADEIAALADLLPGATILGEPTRDAVLAALPGHSVTHFACHGRVNLDNPASSQLVLMDHEAAPLTLADISSLRLAGAMAYLSACDTAVTATVLANESVHLMGAFQLAGYAHVVGTLWPVNDSAARRLAQAFYAQLTSNGRTSPDPDRSARALHHATRQLRDRYRDFPALWAGHIHSGS